jgi:hypothetical protein
MHDFSETFDYCITDEEILKEVIHCNYITIIKVCACGIDIVSDKNPGILFVKLPSTCMFRTTNYTFLSAFYTMYLDKKGSEITMLMLDYSKNIYNTRTFNKVTFNKETFLSSISIGTIIKCEYDSEASEIYEFVEKCLLGTKYFLKSYSKLIEQKLVSIHVIEQYTSTKKASST